METPAPAHTPAHTHTRKFISTYCTHTSWVFAVVVVVLPLVFERQLVAQGRRQSEQAGSTGPGGQGGLEACWVWRERDRNGVAVGEVLRLELLLLNSRHKNNN